jgi:thiamine-monophosphate kinase
VGEETILRRLRRWLRRRGHGEGAGGVLLGAGDDTAVLRGQGRLLLTCDVHLEGRHFLSRWISPPLAGRRVVVSNVSDVAAMGGEPVAALLSLALPPGDPVRVLFGIVQGVAAALEEVGGRLVGGNLASTPGPRVLDLTLVGRLPGRPWLRSGGRAGDDLLLVGFPGRAAAGLELLGSRRGGPRVLREAYLRPVHRLAEARRLRGLRGVHAAIDVSDGLLLDLSRLCEASGVGASLDSEAVGADPVLGRFFGAGEKVLARVLGPSDDYALLLAVAPSATPRVLERLGQVARRIGRLEAARGIRMDGQRLDPKGWDHFRGKLPRPATPRRRKRGRGGP